MKRLVTVLLWLTLVGAVLWAAGLVATRLFERGADDEESEDFRVGAFWGGRTFTSRSASLCSGTAVAALGGVDVDLTAATPHPAGVDLSLRCFMGGMRVLVPRGWRVEVQQDVIGGQCEVRTAEPDSLPEDAPCLDVDAQVRGGGLVIQAGD